ncbi:MAG TPA: DUF1295 domain-containing protein [Hyphomicrobiaceae bacterium]|nr:DUF1295 domain-containing protein [Hyphomicrobiaceae bacterium]
MAEALRMTLIPWLGVCLGIGAMLFTWWLITYFRRPSFADLHEVAVPVACGAVFICLFVMWYTTWRAGPASAKSCQLGYLLTGRWNEIDTQLLSQEALAWLVRVFFLPLNFSESARVMSGFRIQPEHYFDRPVMALHADLLMFIYGMIVTAIIPGYLFASRLFSNEVRLVDRTLSAWVVTLWSYAPFLVNGAFFYYRAENWQSQFSANGLVLCVVGFCILLFELVHYWGEAQMGIRASNLSHRGIITTGPFRYTRHPIYLSKCIGWFFIWMPVTAGENWVECVRLTVLFVMACSVYFARSWVEERLLASDKDYVTYALWVDRHGLLARLGRHIPALTFEWRYRRWLKDGAIISDGLSPATR